MPPHRRRFGFGHLSGNPSLRHPTSGKPCWRFATPGRPRGRSFDDVSETEQFVPVAGVVNHQTSLGVFLEVARRRVFIPANCMSAPSAGFEAGEPAVLLVLRRFAEEEGVTAVHGLRSDARDRSRDTIQSSEKSTRQKAKAPSRSRLFQDRIIAMCVVETTAAAHSGIASWKTKPCRLLLRLNHSDDGYEVVCIPAHSRGS
jgi:hypothetical protein